MRAEGGATKAVPQLILRRDSKASANVIELSDSGSETVELSEDDSFEQREEKWKLIDDRHQARTTIVYYIYFCYLKDIQT